MASLLRVSLTYVSGEESGNNGQYRLSQDYVQKIFRVNTNAFRCVTKEETAELQIRLCSYFNDRATADAHVNANGATVFYSDRIHSQTAMLNYVLDDLLGNNITQIYCRINGKYFSGFANYVNHLCNTRKMPRYRFIRLRKFYSPTMPLSSMCRRQHDHCSRTCEVCFVDDLQNNRFDKSVSLKE